MKHLGLPSLPAGMQKAKSTPNPKLKENGSMQINFATISDTTSKQKNWRAVDYLLVEEYEETQDKRFLKDIVRPHFTNIFLDLAITRHQ